MTYPTSPSTRKRTQAKWRFLVSLASASALLVAVDTARGAGAVQGEVRGKVVGYDKIVPDVYVEAAKPESHRYTWRERSPTVKAEFSVLYPNPSREICIAAISGNAGAQQHDPILVRVTGGRTIPATLVVEPGWRLSFKNSDPFPHRLVQVGEAKWVGQMAPQAQREWTAPGPGRYEFRDELFPSVRTFVVVEPTAVDFVYPARDGTFVMKLPPGEYTLKAFFAGKPIGKEFTGLKIPDKGGVIELKESLNVAGENK